MCPVRTDVRALALLAGVVLHCACQTATVDSIAASHIEANAPRADELPKFLSRDLKLYLDRRTAPIGYTHPLNAYDGVFIEDLGTDCSCVSAVFTRATYNDLRLRGVSGCPRKSRPSPPERDLSTRHRQGVRFASAAGLGEEHSTTWKRATPPPSVRLT